METFNEKAAKTMDFINERVIAYFNRESKTKATYLSLNDELYAKYKFDFKIYEYAIRLMIDEGYIKNNLLPDGSTTTKDFDYTSKGLLLYLNGGFTKQLKREKAKNRLYFFGQISICIAALYYMLEIIEILI